MCSSDLADALAVDDPARLHPLGHDDAVAAWWQSWRARLADERQPIAESVSRLRQANPALVPRNHQVEAALEAALAGDLAPFERLRQACARPFDDDPAMADLAEPPGAAQWQYRTFCGT